MSADDVAWEKKSKFHLIEVVAYWEGRVTNDHLKRAFKIKGIRNFWLIKCQRCKEENLSQRII